MGRKLSILVSENNAGSIFKNIKKVLTQRQTRELEPNNTKQAKMDFDRRWAKKIVQSMQRAWQKNKQRVS